MFVVAGVTGKTGSVVADTLLAAQKPVRVLVRAMKGALWKAKGAEVHVLPSLDDCAGLTAALRGASGAYLLSPPDRQSHDFLAERRRTFDAVATAIDASQVDHVVLLSSIGAQHATGTGQIASLHIAEQRLRRTKHAKLTFVRAAFFLENFAAVASAAKAGSLPSFLPAALAVPTVTTRDIGLVAAKALLEGPPAQKIDIIELAGARDLSARDVAALFASKVGRDVAVEEHPFDAVVPTYTRFGISTHIAALFREMYEGTVNGTIAWEGGKARLVRGTTDPVTVIEELLA